MKKYLILICILVGFAAVSAAQVKQTIPDLKVGDHIPDIVLNHIIGTNVAVNLSDLDNQDLLIINFWATWCAPCIGELTTFNNIVEHYNGKVKVLSVAYENEYTVKKFFKNHPEIKTDNLIITTEDSVLIRYFRHRILPHNIWVDKKGVVKNITGLQSINDEKIRDFINNIPLKVSNKNDILNFDPFENFHLRDSDFICRSIFTRAVQGINNGLSLFSVWGHPNDYWLIRAFLFNESRQQILWTLLYGNSSHRDYYNIMKIETKDSTRFFWPKQCPATFKTKYSDEWKWRSENTFCFDMTLPKAVPDTVLFNYMLEDFKRLNNIEISKIYLKMPICEIKIQNRSQFKTAVNDSSYFNISTDGFKVHNYSILKIFQYLNEKAKPDKNAKPLDPPYIDETRVNYKIDLELKFKKKNPTYQEVKNWLSEKFGFSYQYDIRPYPTYLIKDLVH
jgi:thiol-disulfide isomerase/thioredoxin